MEVNVLNQLKQGKREGVSEAVCELKRQTEEKPDLQKEVTKIRTAVEQTKKEPKMITTLNKKQQKIITSENSSIPMLKTFGPKKQSAKKSEVAGTHSELELETESGIKRSSIFLQRKNDLLCFERIDTQTGKKLTGLIDIGASNNYILKENVKNVQQIRSQKPKEIITKYGKIEITQFVRVNLLTYDMNCLLE